MLIAALLALATLAWFATRANSPPHMRTGLLTGIGMAPMGAGTMGPSMALLGVFLWMWLVMMVAMMLPAITPVVVTFDRWVRKTGRSRSATAHFVGGYLLIWGGSGLAVYGAIVYLTPVLPSGESALRLGAGLLVLAGAYQLTPLKEACLRHCRSPLGFIAQHTSPLRRGGLAGSRVGAIHGIYCLGCCWALMLVLVLLGMMSMVWMAAVAGVIFLEKTLPRRWPVGKLVGLLLVSVGIVLLVSPRPIRWGPDATKVSSTGPNGIPMTRVRPAGADPFAESIIG